jgi:hypothetical protein
MFQLAAITALHKLIETQDISTASVNLIVYLLMGTTEEEYNEYGQFAARLYLDDIDVFYTIEDGWEIFK